MQRSKSFVMILILLLVGWTAGSIQASELVPQVWLQGDTIFPAVGFTTPLPIFGPGYNAALPRVNALENPFLKVTMKEVTQQVLPAPYPPTHVWAYETSNAFTGKVLGPAHWPAVTIETQRFVPTTLKYVNDLPSFNPSNSSGPPFTSTGLVQGLVSGDQSIHWADPLNNSGAMTCVNVDCTLSGNASSPCCNVFTGTIPAVAHLHGGETLSNVDGEPGGWFTPNGLRGPDYFSYGNPGPGEAIYAYDNLQEPGTIWFHDHALGLTRTNVYSGLEGFYFIRGPLTEPNDLPTGAYEIEMAIQDRQFDTNGQLFFPDGSPNGNPASPIALCGDLTANDPCFNGPPSNPNIHPFWIPEFFGDVAIVNGAPWPVLNVEPRRYLFRLLDGSNARMYNLVFGAAGEPSPPVYVVGTDDNYLDAPVKVNGRTISYVDGSMVSHNPPSEIFMAPGERAYIIVDFSGLQGKTITLTNDAPAPFPTGTLIPGTPGQTGMAKIMQFKVSLPLKSKTDTSCNPATGGCKRPIPVVQLTDGKGNLEPGVKIDKVRQIVLKEHEGQGGTGGPVEVLVNNTRFEGMMSPGIAGQFPVDGVSELPRIGATELWEVINLTMDAHPMHTHLVQFQVLNREDFTGNEVMLTGGYYDAWGAAFGFPNNLPAQCISGVSIPADTLNPQNPCPGYGPPLAYNVPNADGALGGNPAIGPFLKHNATPPNPEEAGWKDVAKAYPGTVSRFVVRWTPTSISNSLTQPGRSFYTFDPTSGPGYVWHCHIIDHEDNDMMRPYKVVK